MVGIEFAWHDQQFRTINPHSNSDVALSNQLSKVMLKPSREFLQIYPLELPWEPILVDCSGARREVREIVEFSIIDYFD